MRNMSALILLILFCTSTQAIVIRHDKPDSHYKNRTTATSALVTFVTPHQGKSFVVGAGVYIGGGWVLTAAHVANFFEEPDKAELNGEKLAILDVVLHEKWRDKQFGFDIALVKVTQPSNPVETVELFSYELRVGNKIIIAGRGDSGDGIKGLKPSDLQLRVAENIVDKVSGQWMSFTFNAPNNGALEFEGISGSGDSGSPAYIIDKGKTHILGISSWQDTQATDWQQGLYNVVEYYTYLPHYKAWLQKHLTNNL